MDLQLKDKVLIVTGGAKGIGAAIVRAAAGEGAVPVIVDRDEKAGSATKRRNREERVDCRGTLQAGRVRVGVRKVLARFGRIDALVNNAGVNDKVGLEHGSPREYVASLERNLLHYYNLAHYCLPALKMSKGSHR